MRVETKYHPRLAMRSLRCLRAEEPFRVPAGNFDLNDEPSAHVSRVKLSESSVKFLAAMARVPKITLSQRMVETQEIKSDY